MSESGSATERRKTRLLHLMTVPESLAFLDGHVAYTKHNGFDVHALSSPGPLLDEFGARRKVEVHGVPMPRSVTPLRDLSSLWSIGRIMRRFRPDIVHGHTPKAGLLGMIGAWLCGVPIRIYHMYGLPMVTAKGLRRLLLRWSEKISCLLAHQVLCLSQSLRTLALAEGLCSPEKIKVLLNGNIVGVDAEGLLNPAHVDPQARQDLRRRHGIPADALVVGFAGRIVRDKGLIELTEAFTALGTDFPNLHLLVVGPFEPQDPLPPSVEALLRSDPRIHLTGAVGPREMPAMYQGMDVLAVPTYREGFGTVFLEGAAMELPVIGTRVPGCLDAVRDGETGKLVPSQDAPALADALRAYLGNAELRRQHGLAGRRRVLRDFRPEAMSEEIYREYLRLLRRNGRGGSRE